MFTETRFLTRQNGRWHEVRLQREYGRYHNEGGVSAFWACGPRAWLHFCFACDPSHPGRAEEEAGVVLRCGAIEDGRCVNVL
jgi:hypothetical protein